MRLWSIHPMYLDSKGLVACWRESLLAKEVLKGNTKGYKNHSQLTRFKNSKYPINHIIRYLGSLHDESIIRGFKFDRNLIFRDLILATPTDKLPKIQVTTKQLEYEFNFLQSKLKSRCLFKIQHNEMLIIHNNDVMPVANPIFEVVEGEIESWENVKSLS